MSRVSPPTFNSLRVLLQPPCPPSPPPWPGGFQFSSSLIATLEQDGRFRGIRPLFQFSSSLIATRPHPSKRLLSSRLSILFESYCNSMSAKRSFMAFLRSFNSLRVLLQHVKAKDVDFGDEVLSILFESYCNPRVEALAFLRLLAFNSLRVLLQRCPFCPRPSWPWRSCFQFSSSLIATGRPRRCLMNQSSLSILFESYCNHAFPRSHPLSRKLSILFESYCNRPTRRAWPSRPRVGFQFSSSLIATKRNPALTPELINPFNSLRVLLQLVFPKPEGPINKKLSILFESYCNMHRCPTWYEPKRTFNSLRVLLQPGRSSSSTREFNRFQFSSSLIATLGG